MERGLMDRGDARWKGGSAVACLSLASAASLQGGSVVDTFAELFRDEPKYCLLVGMVHGEMPQEQRKAEVVEAIAKHGIETLGMKNVARVVGAERDQPLRPSRVYECEDAEDFLVKLLTGGSARLAGAEGFRRPVFPKPRQVAKFRGKLARDCSVFLYDVLA